MDIYNISIYGRFLSFVNLFDNKNNLQNHIFSSIENSVNKNRLQNEIMLWVYVQSNVHNNTQILLEMKMDLEMEN
jgi:hypothetical protein